MTKISLNNIYFFVINLFGKFKYIQSFGNNMVILGNILVIIWLCLETI